ncbi:MAG: hypothetical protein O2960_03295 [Verrucomicrobia bacterium]|nr:hypothetical protein [Verrucomicrobiota bacterium]
MPLHIHIEHVVLEGTSFAASDSRAFRAALERELAAQSAGMEARPWSSGRRNLVNAPDISPSALASLSSWAESSARSLLAAVTPATR